MIDQRRHQTELNLVEHSDFEFVKRGQEDLLVIGVGWRAGKVLIGKDEYDHLAEYNHHYIKCHDPAVVERLSALSEEMMEHARFESSLPRIFHVTEGAIVSKYIEKYDPIFTPL